MGSINFKSVGKTKTSQIAQQLIKSPVPIGIVTPLRFGKNTFFALHYSLSDTIKDNLRNLILTNWGERLIHYDFGGNLRPLLSEFVSLDDFDSQAIERISGAVSKWMPFVSLENYESKIDHQANTSSSGTAVVRLLISYSIPALQIRNQVLELTLYMM